MGVLPGLVPRREKEEPRSAEQLLSRNPERGQLDFSGDFYSISLQLVKQRPEGLGGPQVSYFSTIYSGLTGAEYSCGGQIG